jgi:hypothetical protein
MPMRIPIGVDDFRELREGGLEYVDKTHLIQEIIDRPGVKVMLVPRPRRFGKSVNLSMLRVFFEKREEDLWPLFEGLRIDRAGGAYRAHFQRYPVVSLSFKGIKPSRFADCREAFIERIITLFDQHRAVLDSAALSEVDQRRYRQILDGTASSALYAESLFHLTAALQRAHGERAIVLIDEYDAPIHAAWQHGYYREAVELLRGFLEAGLKDNPHLHKGVLTGILRVARESIFSGLNNLAVYTLLNEEMNTCFGFTEPEVAALLEEAGAPELLPSVRAYYNGYVFGGEPIYNPWSILHFIASTDRALVPYWVTSSANELVKSLLERHAFAVDPDMETLLSGGSIEKKIDEDIVFPELLENQGALWSLLVFSGYLRAERGPVTPGLPLPPARLSIPNEEVAQLYRTTFQSWMDQGLRAKGGAADALLDALLKGDVERLERQLQLLATHLVSYHDAATADPERFYHGLMLGLLASLEPDYEVRSNRESGEGRPDVWIKPRRAGKPGVVLELKLARPKGKTMARALLEGREQIEKGDYRAELRAAGVEPVHALVVAFDGKKVRVESADAPRAGGGVKRTRRRETPRKRKRPAGSSSRVRRGKRGARQER